ncbi:MAG: YfiT family bacillithiol transferase [Bacteroidota bacterium]
MHSLQYPIGKPIPEPILTPAQRVDYRQQIEAIPQQYRSVASQLSEAQLDTPYRPGGWTARQVIHHVPDSHLNAYLRFRWALTEDEPTLKAYDEQAWAQLHDAQHGPIEVSLALLEALHTRWGLLIASLSEADFARRIRHPESGWWTVDELLSHYVWHGAHHLAHLKLVLGESPA